MSIQLHNLSPSKGAKKSKKRLGRGIGSGKGKTSGRGHKGQKSRAGASGFQRLGMRKLMFATPKLRGFKSMHADHEVVNVSTLEEAFDAGMIISPKVLKEKGLIRGKGRVKILGDGEVKKNFTIQGCAVSKSAAEKITAAGGNIQAS